MKLKSDVRLRNNLSDIEIVSGGNSIVVQVLEAIFKELLFTKKELENENTNDTKLYK